MASSMGQTWEVTSFTYLFFDHFQTNLAVGRDISPIESVAQCLPVLEGGCGAMHPPHHASAWTLPAQWLSGTHSQSQTTLRWVWFPKTFTVRCDHQGYTISQCVFYILHFTWTIPWVSESPYYFGGPGSTRFRQFIQLLDPHVLTSCSRDAPGKHGKAWRSALRIFMGRPRMATISQDFLLPYQALSRKWQLKQATSTSVWWMDKSNMLLSVPRFYVPQEGYTKRFKDFWRKQFWDRFLQNEGCPNHSCVHHRYPKSWKCQHVDMFCFLILTCVAFSSLQKHLTCSEAGWLCASDSTGLCPVSIGLQLTSTSPLQPVITWYSIWEYLGLGSPWCLEDVWCCPMGAQDCWVLLAYALLDFDWFTLHHMAKLDAP